MGVTRCVRGGRTLEFFYEFIESIMDFSDLGIELVLDIVHFCMNGWNVCIHLGLKGSNFSTKFLIGFFLAGGSHEWMSGPRGKINLKMRGITMIKVKRGIQ
jgi:hypothetical protein